MNEAPPVDTRTYYDEPEIDSSFCSRCGADCQCVTERGLMPAVPRATMTRDVVIGHSGEHGWPCPATHGQGTCEDAWQAWRIKRGIELMRV
jgi:hypothetical protein